MSALQLTSMQTAQVIPPENDQPATGDVLPLRYSNASKKTYRSRMVQRNPFCIYCGTKLTQQTATLEHFHPRSAGGDHQPWNLFLACTDCNSERSSRDIPEWVAELRAKADRLELAYRRMLGEEIDTDDTPTRWPVALEFPSQGAHHEG